MPASYQQILMEAARKTAVEHRRLIDEMNDRLLGELRGKGMEVNLLTAEQKKAFANAASGVHQQFIDKFGPELVNLARKYNQ